MNCYTCKRSFNEKELIYWVKVRLKIGDDISDGWPMDDGPLCKKCIYKKIEYEESAVKIYRQTSETKGIKNNV